MTNRFDRARRAAAAALMRVHRGGWASLAADRALAAPSLSPRDRAFTGALFFGSAERLVTLDALLAPLLSRPLEKLDVEVRAILETGLYQLLYMRVPARAAVDETVKLATAMGKGSAGGLVNAVLRKAAAKYADVAGEEPNEVARRLLGEDLFTDEETRMGLLYSVSAPVARALMESLPDEYEDYLAASFATSFGEAGVLSLRVNTLRTSADELAAQLAGRGIAVQPGPLPTALLANIPGGVQGEPLFDAGLYGVQGIASQWAVASLAPRAGERVLDLCAAPGGKSAAMGQEMGGGAGLTVRDLSEGRLEKARALFARLGIAGADIAAGDATVYDEDLAGQDAVLCDVPCSGLGVMGKKPDLRYAAGENFGGSHAAALPGLQLKILSTAARYVKRGGRLLYSTCTVRRQENEEVVQAFLQNHPGFAPAPPPAVPEGARIEGGMMTLLPHRTGTDGFFITLLECM